LKKKRCGGGKVFKFVSISGKEYKLNPQEKKFCEFYISLDGCGAEAYEQAGYECKNRNVAKTGAWQLGQREHINAYINKLLNDQGFEDKNVAKQHLFLINQHADLASKSRGIDMFYKLGGKYAAEKVKFIDENEELTDEEIEDELARRAKLGQLDKKSLAKKKAKSA
jgi:phage terminase small subunit